MRSTTSDARRRLRLRPYITSIKNKCPLPAVRGLNNLSLAEASRGVQAGEVRPSDLTEACFAQMERSSWLNCFVTRCVESARSQAEAADARQANGSLLGPLDGIPYAAKDNFCTIGVPTTASSRVLASFKPPYDSTATRRLSEAGSPLLGKTNMDEFGMGSGNFFSCHGRTLNPWSPGPNASSVDGDEDVFAPGGSSGGSAAAVSSGTCFAALGSDTGGSVRTPAAFCGVVGLKPTYGLVPRHGMIAYASSLDTAGILARSVLDSAMVLDVIAGPDANDSTCLPTSCAGGFASALLENRWDATVDGCLEGVTIGIPKDFNVEELDAGARGAWEYSATTAAALGASIVEVSLPSVPRALSAYGVIASAEASSNLSRYDGLRYGEPSERVEEDGIFRSQRGLHQEIGRTRTAGFGDEVKRRILTGCFVLSESVYHSYYELAIKIQRCLRREMHAALSEADVLLAPTTPFPPPVSGPLADPVSLLLNDVLTVPVNLAGLPAISIPVSTVQASTPTREGVARDTGSGRVKDVGVQGGIDGFVGGGCWLPLGMQVIGRPLGEVTVLQVAHALEHQFDFTSQVPERVRTARV